MITSGREAMNRRVLVIDDNESIHDDFRKVLMPTSAADDDLLVAEAELFGEPVSVVDRVTFELTFASQGQQGHQLVKDAVAAGRPFAMAFVDMRMPPGWDGLETIVRIWADCPDIEMVICTAFSDYSWDEIVRRLGRTDRLLIVKKPFDQVEILQVASALTHKWNLQQEARRGLENLNTMVEERTRDLRAARDQLLALNGELLAAREAAEAANRSKTMFLANISHELRTPMTAILGYSEELQERFSCSLGSSIECDALETIRRNAKHMVGIIGDLLDIAKLEAGKLTAEVGCCAPLHVLAEVVELLQAKASAKNLELTVTYDNAVPEAIRSDALRLRQVLVNLIDNAIKFTSNGGVRISVRLDEAAEQLHFAVRDSGMGMSREVLDRLFRPFEQADVSTTRRFGGTGLGLAISQQLAGLLGGRILVESEVGRGTQFTFSVGTGPLQGVARVATVDHLGQRPAETVPDASAAAAGARVLLVEDGPDNQRLITRILERAGCSIVVAGNGQEGLDRMATTAAGFDLVLMDMQMPVMDGLTATRCLRDTGCSLPIVALTANAMQSDQEACLAAGCDAFLTKPIDRRRLVETIGRLVAAAREGH